jgi:hypothetical protein
MCRCFDAKKKTKTRKKEGTTRRGRRGRRRRRSHRRARHPSLLLIGIPHKKSTIPVKLKCESKFINYSHMFIMLFDSLTCMHLIDCDEKTAKDLLKSRKENVR